MADVWAHLAERYEEAYGPKSESPCWPRAERLAVLVDGPVLDLACGAGFELSLFRHAVGIDSSPAMLATARRREPSARLALGDVRALPFRRGAFAGAFSCLALIHLTKAECAATLRDLRAMLRPGAPVSVTFFAGQGERDTGFSPLDPSAVAHYSYYDAAELEQMLRGAGYRDVAVEEAVLNEPTRPSIPCLCVWAVA
jgi:SAM-dependent methyltransferase